MTIDAGPGVDVIILVRIPDSHKHAEETKERYGSLLKTLQDGGLKAVGRRGDSDGKILVFVSCPEAALNVLIHKAREIDFLSGLPVTPIPDQYSLSPAERIRLVHSFITSAPSDGGLGIHPDIPRWGLISSVFCLHDLAFNELWLQKWASNWISTASVPHEQIRAHFGDAFSLYFIFIQSYSRALGLPAVVGFLFWMFGASYSPIYSFLISIWAIGFVEWWRVEERRIAMRFGVRGATRVEKARVQNAHQDDSPWIREFRILATIPVILGFALLLAVLMTAIFLLEEFCEHFYTGPGQQYVAFAPTVVYAILVPHLISFFQSCAEWFATWENHPHHSGHDASVTLKTFIFTALVAYLSLTLTALVYVPFGDALVKAALRWFPSTTLGNGLKLDRSRLEEQMFAYTATNQIIDSIQEIGWPYAMKTWDTLFGLIWNLKHEQPVESGPIAESPLVDSPTSESPTAGLPLVDSPISESPIAGFPLVDSPTSETPTTGLPLVDSPTSESFPEHPHTPFSSAFSNLRSFSTSLTQTLLHPSFFSHSQESLLTHAIHESSLPSTPANLSTDYSEMVIQFGYIVLWSTIFPLAPLFALLNNIIEMRKDAFRIAKQERRPIPERTESIGAWLEVLEFLGWSGIVVNTILVALFCPRGGQCGHLFDLTGDTGTPIEMISLALSDAVWDEEDRTAWRELGLTVLLLVLAASQAWVLVRAALRHLMHKVLWEGSSEVERWRTEERKVKEAFLEGFQGQELQADTNEGKTDTENMASSSPDLVTQFWAYDEGMEEIQRLKKEE